MAIREFRLPDPGEGLVEADIVTWRVAVGDQVKINDIVVEVETSKSLVELPTPYAGTVSELLVAEGETVEVGAPIIAIDDGVAAEPRGDDGVAAEPLAAEAPPATTWLRQAPEDGDGSGGRVAMLVGYGPKTTEAKRRPRKQTAADPEREQAHAMMAGTFATDAPVSRRADEREPLVADAPRSIGNPLPVPGPAAPEPVLSGGAVLAKPPVRKLAKDLGVDLNTITGSGPGGVITRDDVTVASQREGVEGAGARDLSVPSNQAPPTSERFDGRTSSEVAGADLRIPIKGVRKAMAQAMVQSAFTAPHVSEWLTCDVTATVELLDRIRARREFAEIKISPLLIIARAVCLALRRTPELNSSWDEAAQEIVIKSAINLGIAAATPRGLVVPNIRDAGRLGLVDLAAMINQVVAAAREGRTQPADMSGGTFTITNIGVFGVDGGTPILNPGEAGILCVGQIARRPWVMGVGVEERIEPRWTTTLSISFDHRLADGAQGSTFLADIAGILGDPGLALLY